MIIVKKIVIIMKINIYSHDNNLENQPHSLHHYTILVNSY